MVPAQSLWDTFEVMGPTLSAVQRRHAFKTYLDTVRHTAVLPERRARSCPRVLRQPVKRWPRKIEQPSHTGHVDINVVPI